MKLTISLKNSFLTLCLLALCSVSGEAIELRQTNDFSLAKGTVASNELGLLAGRVNIEGTLQDDAFMASSGDMLLNGTFRGDIWGLANRVELGGLFSDDVRVLADKTLTISGNIEGDLLAIASKTIRITPQARIGGSVICAAQTVVNEGAIAGGARFFANKISLGGSFAKDLDLRAGDITFMKGTRISGDLRYLSSGEIFPGKQATILGQTIRKPTPAEETFQERLYGQIPYLIATLLAALVLIAIFPNTILTSLNFIRQKPGHCVLSGLAGFLLILAAGFLGIVTIVGIPLAMIVIGSSLILIYTGKIVVGLTLGTLILRKRNLTSFRRLFFSAVLGLAIIYLASAIPESAIGIWLGVSSLGFGSLILSLFNLRKRAALGAGKDFSARAGENKENNNLNPKEETNAS